MAIWLEEMEDTRPDRACFRADLYVAKEDAEDLV